MSPSKNEREARERRRQDRQQVEDAAAAEDLAAIYAHIMDRAPEHDIDPTLDRVARVLELLGDPQKAYRTIHIAGTNGKTSTARMVERLVREHGLRTGRFTSPHLSSVTERIAVDGEPISATRFVEVWNDISAYIGVVDRESEEQGGPRLSFFEVLTVMAFAAFADTPIDVAVIEVGMGGTWDSTNAVDGEVAVITPIAMDHERWLGHTLPEIADNKAGIITEGATVVVGEQEPAAEVVVIEAATARHARVLRDGLDLEVANRTPAVGGQLMDLRTPAGLYTEIFVPVLGAHQAHNALLALAAVEALLGGRALGGEIVETAFADVSSPGRLEVLRSSPTVLVDAAHNPAGAEALVAALEESFAFTHLVGVVSVMADKDVEGLLAVLEPHLASVILTSNSSDRAADPLDLAEIANDVFGEDRVLVIEDLSDAVTRAADLAEAEDVVGVGTGTGVLVTGSVITAADARALLRRS